MSGYIQSIANQRETIEQTGIKDRQAIRQKFTSSKAHARTPDILANLMLGWTMFLQYAFTIDAISVAQKRTYEERLVKALSALNENQANYQREADPARLFITHILTAVWSQLAHIANMDGRPPNPPNAWGWKHRNMGGEEGGTDWHECGMRVGYIDRDEKYIYLDEAAAYKVAQNIARGSGQEIVINKLALRQRLAEANYLIGEQRGGKTYNTARVTILGQRMNFLRIPYSRMVEDERDADGELVLAFENEDEF